MTVAATGAPAYPTVFQPGETFARELDAVDPLARYRDLFHIPKRPDGEPVLYFCGHSLGLLPKATGSYITQELDAWAAHGVEGHFHGPAPWYTYQELFRPSIGRLVGAVMKETKGRADGGTVTKLIRERL